MKDQAEGVNIETGKSVSRLLHQTWFKKTNKKKKRHKLKIGPSQRWWRMGNGYLGGKIYKTGDWKRKGKVRRKGFGCVSYSVWVNDGTERKC